MRTALLSAWNACIKSDESFEIIVVDNGSTDGSPGIVREFASRYDGNVRLLSCHQPGVANARNYGVEHSRSEWLQFLDADDTLMPDKLLCQLARVRAAKWVIGGYQDLHFNHLRETFLPNADPWKGLVHGNGIGHTGSNLISRMAFDRVGGYDRRLRTAEDLDLYGRLLASGLEYYIDDNVRSFYHVHDCVSLSREDVGACVNRRLGVFDRAIDYLRVERPKYWQREKDFFFQAIVNSARVLATYDLVQAARWFDRYKNDTLALFHDGHSPHLPTYTRLYPYLGFRNVEASRRVLARVLPAGLKARLKG